MSPPQSQSVARISKELGIHVMTLYSWRKAWQHQGEVVPASQKDPEGWGPADKFTVVLETVGLRRWICPGGAWGPGGRAAGGLL